MGVSLIFNDKDELTDIRELIDREIEKDIEVSTEHLGIPRNTPDAPVAPGESSKNNNDDKCVFFTKMKTDKGNFDWTFMLNNAFGSPFNPYIQFAMAMCDVAPNDNVFIYGPSAASVNEANLIISSMIGSASKNIKMAIPFIGGIGSAYILSYAKEIVYSPYDLFMGVMDVVTVGGGLWDAKSALNMHNLKFNDMLDRLKLVGLITDEEHTHLLEKQGQILVYGSDLVDRYKAYNSKNR